MVINLQQLKWLPLLSHAGRLADLIFGNIYLSAGKKEKEKNHFFEFAW